MRGNLAVGKSGGNATNAIGLSVRTAPSSVALEHTKIWGNSRVDLGYEMSTVILNSNYHALGPRCPVRPPLLGASGRCQWPH